MNTEKLVVVCFLLGNSPASEFYMPKFWNTTKNITQTTPTKKKEKKNNKKYKIKMK
jgi:hypothetical protein